MIYVLIQRSMATHLTKNWKMKQNPKEDLYIRESKLQGIEEVKVKNEGLPETLNGDGVEMKERVIGRNEKRKREWGKGYIGERKVCVRMNENEIKGRRWKTTCYQNLTLAWQLNYVYVSFPLLRSLKLLLFFLFSFQIFNYVNVNI